MQLVKERISIDELKKMSKRMFGHLVKAVVDIEREIMVVDASLHSDQESLLLDEGSEQASLWGINLYPEKTDDSWIEFDSMINLRPSWGNESRGVDDPVIRAKIIHVVLKLVAK
jgi:uncharacterized protein DUF5674